MTREDVAWLATHGVPCVVTMGGGSMVPTLPVGARVRIAPLSESPRRGDIVLIRAGEDLILHRVAFVSARWVGHHGDASTHSSLAERSEIVGCAVALADGAPLPRQVVAVRVRGRWARLVCAARVWRKSHLIAAAPPLSQSPPSSQSRS